MTKAAIVKTADLNRMADVAKKKGVCVEIEIDGAKIRVYPDMPKPEPVVEKKKPIRL